MNIYKLPDNPIDIDKIVINDNDIYFRNSACDTRIHIKKREDNFLLIEVPNEGFSYIDLLRKRKFIDFKETFKMHKKEDIFIDYKFPENNLGFKYMSFSTINCISSSTFYIYLYHESFNIISIYYYNDDNNESNNINIKLF